jgi:preprotein translocase subunit SecB
MSGYDHHDNPEFEIEVSKDIDVNVDLNFDVDVDFNYDKDVDVKVDIKTDVDLEGNSAVFAIDVEALGGDTHVELALTVMTIEDTLSMISATGTAASD